MGGKSDFSISAAGKVSRCESVLLGDDSGFVWEVSTCNPHTPPS